MATTKVRPWSNNEVQADSRRVFDSRSEEPADRKPVLTTAKVITEWSGKNKKSQGLF